MNYDPFKTWNLEFLIKNQNNLKNFKFLVEQFLFDKNICSIELNFGQHQSFLINNIFELVFQYLFNIFILIITVFEDILILKLEIYQK